MSATTGPRQCWLCGRFGRLFVNLALLANGPECDDCTAALSRPATAEEEAAYAAFKARADRVRAAKVAP